MSSVNTNEPNAPKDENLLKKMGIVITVQRVDSTGKKPAERNEFTLAPVDSWEQYKSYKDPASAMLTIATFAATITFTIILIPRDNGQTTPGLIYLAYANSLFCGGIIGCVLITIAIELCHDSEILDGRREELKKKRKEMLDLIGTLNPGEGAFWTNIFSSQGLRQVWFKAMYSDIPDWLNISTNVLSKFIAVISGFVGVTLLAAFYIMIYATRLFLRYNGPFILGSVIYLGFGVVALLLWIRNLWCKHLVDMATERGDKLRDMLKEEVNKKEADRRADREKADREKADREKADREKADREKADKEKARAENVGEKPKDVSHVV
jgi:hypothetical protein